MQTMHTVSVDIDKSFHSTLSGAFHSIPQISGDWKSHELNYLWHGRKEWAGGILADLRT